MGYLKEKYIYIFIRASITIIIIISLVIPTIRYIQLETKIMETRDKQMMSRQLEGETSTIRKTTGQQKKKLLKDIPGLKVSFRIRSIQR